MARKIVLLPMEMYRGLLDTKNDTSTDLRETAPLEYEKAQLKKIKKQKRKNASTKNVLYQQQLRRYLKTRKEARDKPIKVQVDGPQNVKLIKSGNSANSTIKTASIDEDGELQNLQIQQQAPGVSFSNEVDDDVFTAPLETSKNLNQSRSLSFSAAREENSPKVTRNRRNLSTKNEAEFKINKLSNLILSNPTRFGVTEDGAILNPRTNRPTFNSNLSWAVKKLVDPNSVITSPPGMRYIKKSVIEDDEARNLVHPSFLQSGRGGLLPNLFRPAKWKK